MNLSLRKRTDAPEAPAEEGGGTATAVLAPEPVAAGPVLLPRVNLLPPEIAERRRFKQVQAGLGVAVLAAVGVVGLLYAGAAGSAADAQGELETTQAQGRTLATQSAAYSDVTRTYAEAAAAKAMLTEAMGEEVRWSRYLNGLSLTVPDNVWVKSLTFSQAAAAPAPGATAPGIGTVSVTGVGFGHLDLASWLESLAGQKGYADPYLTDAKESLIGQRKVVDFTSTVTVTADALSGRYTAPAGG